MASFTGSAFRVDANRKAQPLLALSEDVVSIMPTVAWQWDFNTPRVPVGGRYQGAALRVGEGRVAVFGEATMFTAQLVGPERRHTTRMNSPVAPENHEYLPNVFHWFSGPLDPATEFTNASYRALRVLRARHGAPILDDAGELT